MDITQRPKSWVIQILKSIKNTYKNNLHFRKCIRFRQENNKLKVSLHTLTISCFTINKSRRGIGRMKLANGGTLDQHAGSPGFLPWYHIKQKQFSFGKRIYGSSKCSHNHQLLNMVGSLHLNHEHEEKPVLQIQWNYLKNVFFSKYQGNTISFLTPGFIYQHTENAGR